MDVRIEGTKENLSQNIKNFIDFLLYTKSISSINEISLCAGKNKTAQAEKIINFLEQNGYSIKQVQTEENALIFKIETLRLNAWCCYKDENADYKNFMPWFSIFQDAELII